MNFQPDAVNKIISAESPFLNVKSSSVGLVPLQPKKVAVKRPAPEPEGLNIMKKRRLPMPKPFEIYSSQEDVAQQSVPAASTTLVKKFNIKIDLKLSRSIVIVD